VTVTVILSFTFSSPTAATTFLWNGSGLTPSTTVKLQLNGSTIGSAVTDVNGNTSGSVPIPSILQAGVASFFAALSAGTFNEMVYVSQIDFGTGIICQQTVSNGTITITVTVTY
jgi:hypothetical protein